MKYDHCRIIINVMKTIKEFFEETQIIHENIWKSYLGEPYNYDNIDIYKSY